jgi:hypothetical protein
METVGLIWPDMFQLRVSCGSNGELKKRRKADLMLARFSIAKTSIRHLVHHGQKKQPVHCSVS